MLVHVRAVLPFVASLFCLTGQLWAQGQAYDASRALAADTLQRTKTELRRLNADRNRLVSEVRREVKRMRTTITRGNRATENRVRRAQKDFVARGGVLGLRTLGPIGTGALERFYVRLTDAMTETAPALSAQFGAPAAAEAIVLLRRSAASFREARVAFSAPEARGSSGVFNPGELRSAPADDVAHHSYLAIEALQHLPSTLSEQSYFFSTRAAHTFAPLALSLTGATRPEALTQIAATRAALNAEAESLEIQLSFRNVNISSLSSLLTGARQRGDAAMVRDLERALRTEEYHRAREAAHRTSLLVVSDLMRILDTIARRETIPPAALSSLVAAAAEGISIQADALAELAAGLHTFGQGNIERFQALDPDLLFAEFGRMREVFGQINKDLMPFFDAELRLLIDTFTLTSDRFRASDAAGFFALQAAQQSLFAAVQRIRSMGASLQNGVTAIQTQFAAAEVALRNEVASLRGQSSTLQIFQSRAAGLENLAALHSQQFGDAAWPLILSRVFETVTRSSQLSAQEVSRLRSELSGLIHNPSVRGKILAKTIKRDDLLRQCRSTSCRRGMLRKAIPILRVRRSFLRALPRRTLQHLNEATGNSLEASTGELRRRLDELKRQYV